MPKNGTMAATPAKTPKARKYGTSQDPETERRERRQQHHGDDLADYPGVQGQLEIIQDDSGERPARRRDQRHHALDIGRGAPGQVERHDEHAHHSR